LITEGIKGLDILSLRTIDYNTENNLDVTEARVILAVRKK
jgi:hypothetical protein